VTAHGYNLGIRAQHLLAKEIKNAIASSKDFASHSVLKKYEDKSIHFAKIMFYGTDTIVSLFTNDSKPVRKLRRFVLNFAEKFPPVKQLITRQLTERKNNLFPF
jgi:2-polyprenyl-6-methoxyphenol hydroxylase-like FAD-dependent oxidoreductase